jgi:hypothetical protein
MTFKKRLGQKWLCLFPYHLSVRGKTEVGPWTRLSGGKVRIFERDFLGRRWYVLLPESNKPSASAKMLYFKRYSTSILKKRHAGEISLNCAQKCLLDG